MRRDHRPSSHGWSRLIIRSCPLPEDATSSGSKRRWHRCITAEIRLHAESRNLATLRDTLLPKLISGEIRVPEAGQTVEQVV